MLSPRLMLLLLFCATLGGCGAADAGPAAFSATAPAGWRYVSHTPTRPHSGRVEFSTAELDAALAAGHAAPLFALTRAGTGAVTHTLGVNVRRLGEGEFPSPAAVLAELAAGAPQLKLRTPIEVMVLAGMPAAHTVLHDGDKLDLPVTVVVADGRVYTVAASLPRDGRLEDSVAVVQQFVTSLGFGAVDPT